LEIPRAALMKKGKAQAVKPQTHSRLRMKTRRCRFAVFARSCEKDALIQSTERRRASGRARNWLVRNFVGHFVEHPVANFAGHSPEATPKSICRSLCRRFPVPAWSRQSVGQSGRQSACRAVLLLVAAMLLLLFAIPAAHAQLTYQQIRVFGFTNLTSGSGPLVEATDGLLYGVSSGGGSHGVGVAYKMNRDGSGYTVLHHFARGTGDGQY